MTTYPHHFLHAVRAARGEGRLNPRFRLWLLCAFIAVAGSLCFGASLEAVLPDARGFWYPALALTVAAGGGWILLGPALLLTTRAPFTTVVHTCLVAMVFGEGVLVPAAGVNALLATFTAITPAAAYVLNGTTVACSNVLMAAVIATRLRDEASVPVWQSLALWILVLNGTGLVLFRIFYPEFP
jgi:hypothetical protein